VKGNKFEEVVQNPSEEKQEEAKADANNSFEGILNQLLEMGFTDKERNIAVLVKHKGNILYAVRELLQL
jgi:hypothetical protein